MRTFAGVSALLGNWLDRHLYDSNCAAKRVRALATFTATKMLLPHDFTLSTKRCVLRRASLSDLPHIFSATRIAGFNDGMQWDPPERIEELYEHHEASLKKWDEGTSYQFTIVSQQEDFLGRIEIRQSETLNVWNLGFWIHPNSRSNGYMTEAAQTVVGFGFEMLSANEIEAFHASWNHASRKVLERTGMQWRTHIPQRFQKNGKWVSAERLSVFKPDRPR